MAKDIKNEPRAEAETTVVGGGLEMALERINEEFRRRTKTQASLPSQDAVLLLLFGLMRSGQIRLRRLDGWQDMPAVKEAA